MLSRRNIRIKVMQMLYTMSQDKELQFDEVLRQFRKNFETSYELYLFNVLQLMKVAEYSRQDATQRAAKHLPTAEDKQFTSKLFDNPLMQSLVKNEGLNELFEKHNLEAVIDKDSIFRLYKEFAKTDEYKAYCKNEKTENADHKTILLALSKSLINNESFTEELEDAFASWLDDKSLVVGALKKTIRALPVEDGFYNGFKPTVETTVDFGEVLLTKVHKEDKELLEVIEPTLKNWDADRVAIIDMILLKMALCELTSFPSIPTKVTLNEFVEISKLYSTDKSKDFINGILDRLMKKLNKDGKIAKEGRGLKE